MQEDLLIELKMKLQEIKTRNNEHNNKIKRIRELQRDPSVKEYIKLTGLEVDDLKLIRASDKEIIESFYYSYLYRIKEDDTNGIYVYLGTYAYSNEIDIVHGGNDIRVDYSASNADYRVYLDLEQSIAQNIHISKCEEFERNHIIINPQTYFKSQAYYSIQKEFFVYSVKNNQESAKRMILRKYSRLNKQSK